MYGSGGQVSAGFVTNGGPLFAEQFSEMVSENRTGDRLAEGFPVEEKRRDQELPVVDFVLPLVQDPKVQNGIEESHELSSVHALTAGRLIVFKEFHNAIVVLLGGIDVVQNRLV